MNNVTQPGHFTNVYLKSLQRTTEYVLCVRVHMCVCVCVWCMCMCVLMDLSNIFYHKVIVIVRQSKLKMQDCEGY